jgi:hypothetical protein
MESLILFSPDSRPFDPQVVEVAFRSCSEFKNTRTRTPVGTLIECKYEEPGDWTTIRLSKNAETISLTGASSAALRAAILIQRSLGMPLRMVNNVNSFDLTFSNMSTVEELEAAMENARTS